MKRILISCVALAAFAAPAFAAEPDGTFVFKENKDYTSIENLVGQYSATIIQNGQFVSGNCATVCGPRPNDYAGLARRRGSGAAGLAGSGQRQVISYSLSNSEPPPRKRWRFLMVACLAPRKMVAALAMVSSTLLKALERGH